MNVFLRVGIVDPEPSTREQMRSALAHLDTVWMENECDNYSLAIPSMGDGGPQVIFVGMDADPSAAVLAIDRLAKQFDQCRVIAYSRSSDGAVILRAIRAGAKEFLTVPIDLDDVAEALRNVGASSGPSQCLTLAVAGATGGVGSSSVAVNLASILAEDPDHSVVLIDLDAALGDVDVLLDVVQGQTLLDVLQNVDRLDFGLLRRSLTKLDSGLFLLPRPEHVCDAAAIRPEPLNRLLVQLKASFSHIVLDLSKSYTALDVVALEHCDLAVLVSQLTLPSLRNVVRLQQALSDIEGLDQRMRIVINRCCTQSPVRLKKAEEIMGREIFWQLPNDHALMVDACNKGLPLTVHAARAELTQSLRAMASALVAPPQSGAAKAARAASKARGWFRFWPAPSHSSPSVARENA